MATYSITYQIVTPESAEQGELSGAGWVRPSDGAQIPQGEETYGFTSEQWDAWLLEWVGPPPEIEPFETDDVPGWAVEHACRVPMIGDFLMALRCLRLISEGGYTEPSYHPFDGKSKAWFQQADGDTDYTTGAETRKSLHFDGLTDGTWFALAMLFREASKGPRI